MRLPLFRVVIANRARRGGRTALAIVVLLAALGGTLLTNQGTSAAATVRGEHAGFAAGWKLLWGTDAELARELDGMAATGAGWVRVDFDWPSIEPARGDFRWGPTDRVVAAARARGLRVLALPTYTPTWARPAGTSSKHAPSDPAAYAAFVGAAARRYAPQGVRTWEIWNEPNIVNFWKPAPDAAAYTRLLKGAAAAIRAADGGATILTGGTSPASDTADGTRLAPETFLRRIYDNGGGASFDAVAHHPYSYPVGPLYDHRLNAFRGTTPVLRDLLVSKGHGHRRIWATEFGAPTGVHRTAVTEATQASHLVEGYEAWRAWPWTGPIFFYNWRDTGTDLADREQNFGLVRDDWTPKPAVATLTAHLRATAAPAPAATAPVPAPAAAATTESAHPVWAVAAGGKLRSVGSPVAPATLGAVPTTDVVGISRSRAGGWWVVAADGGIFTLDGAPFLGSTGAIRLNQPIVGMAATPGRGYWFVARDGGIFSFGDAQFKGSTGGIRLNQPIVGMAATRTGNGYWLVASDGGIFTFGDAQFKGSTGAIRLNRPIVGMAGTPTGNGYWLVASDGGIFTFGDATFLGSGVGRGDGTPIVGITASSTGRGYAMATAGGSIIASGDAGPSAGPSSAADRYVALAAG